MVNERVTETVDSNGNVTQRTIERGFEHDRAHTTTAVPVQRRRGGGGLLGAILLLALIAVAAWLFLGGGLREVRKDDSVEGAAKDAGRAVEKTGDAVERAVEKAVK